MQEFVKVFSKLLGIIIISIMMAELTGCTNNSDNINPEPVGNVKLSSNATFGDILVDGNGYTLYFFAMDVSGQSNCEGGCLGSWPLFYSNDIKPGTGLDASDFATITRTDGGMQTTYKGWPLYYYGADGGAGKVNGDGVGNVWFVAKPDYSIMVSMGQLVGNNGKNYTSDYMEGDGETMYLADAEGNTLYSFINDYRNDNNFTSEDMSNNSVWPIFYTDLQSLPSILSADDFGEIEVYGNQQLTFRGWPLYYFGQDEGRGDTKGVSFPQPGIWPVVNTSTADALPGPTVQLMEDANFGKILTDGDGHTLYFFSNDVDGTVNCSGGCLDFWPPFYADEIILKEGSELDMNDFDKVAVEGSSEEQITYRGWPLYYFSPNADGTIEAPGGTAGDGVNGIWFVAKPDYSLMLANGQLTGADGKNYTSDYIEGNGMTKYFIDINGRTLYIFTNDSKDTNNYTNQDFSNDGTWPIFYVELDQLPSEMNSADFGVIDVYGRSQLTFRGWPLYYFGIDAQRGETKGVSVPSPGVWPIANNNTDPAP